MEARAKITVNGRVQGVFFRYNAKKQAIINNLKGHVKNMPNGSVDIIIEGEKYKIDNFIAWCHEGSASSQVDSVSVEWQDFKNEFTIFDVRY